MKSHLALSLLPVLLFFPIACAPEMPPQVSMASELSRAEDLRQHHLLEQALAAYIGIAHHPTSTKSERAEALFHMGQIAFDQGKFPEAMNDWERLTAQYPQSKRAQEVTRLMAELYKRARVSATQAG